MPKSYSQQEKEDIRTRLKEEAAKCLVQYGIRKTTVDELVRRVKIPKGTFYLFYQSKELLLFEVILEQHERVDQKLMETVSSLDERDCTAEKLTDIIVSIYRMIDDIPVLKILKSEEIEVLARKLPQEVLEEHLGYDRSVIDELMQVIPVKKDVDIKALSAAFRGIYFTTLHKDKIGEENFYSVLHLLVYGLVSQMI